jgi:hypothetical protein
MADTTNLTRVMAKLAQMPDSAVFLDSLELESMVVLPDIVCDQIQQKKLTSCGQGGYYNIGQVESQLSGRYDIVIIDRISEVYRLRKAFLNNGSLSILCCFLLNDLLNRFLNILNQSIGNSIKVSCHGLD